MNVALSRVLYAHALVANPRLALGRARAISRPLGDPRWRGANLFLPLEDITLAEILARGTTPAA